MKRSSCWGRIRSAALAFALCGAEPAESAELKVGVASVKINPPLGVGLAGYYHERGNEGMLDDIYAKATVLDDGTTRVGIVVCDLISMPEWIVAEARTIVQERTGMPGGNIMIGATHTHTAPVLVRGTSRDEVDGSTNEASLAYGTTLPKLIADAITAADQRRKLVKLSVAKGHEAEMAHNRRFWMRDGSVGWNPGKLNAQILRPVGPIDPEVGVLYAETDEAKPAPVLTFVNYAMHPDTTSGTRISGDYCGALSRALALYKGPEMLTLFANGTCGDINHLDVRWAGGQSGGHEATRLGTILAAAVFKAYPRLDQLTNAGSLQVRSERVALELSPFTPDELKQAQADVGSLSDKNRVDFMRMVRAHRIMDTAARAGKPHLVEVQVISLGRQVAWVSWPGEIFVALGLSVKAGSPFPHTYNVTLANGTIGYIPNKSAYPEGNYEVESARVAEGSGEKLAAAALRMLSETYEAAR